jgi:hypothetical protein
VVVGNVQSGQPSRSGQFLVGVALGLTFMLLTVLATLYGLGYISARDEGAADDAVARDVPEARPTAVWRYRSEWLTPQPK